MTNHAVLSGIEQREKNRQKNLANKLKKARQSAEKLAERVIDLDKVAIAEDKQAEFDEQWQAFEKQLKNDLQCRTTSTYAHGYNAGIKQIQQQIEARELEVSFPCFIVIEQRPIHFRDKTWFLNGKAWHQVYVDWLESFNQPKTLNITDILLSLILQSGIVDKPILQYILLQITSKKMVIHQVFDLPFVLFSPDEPIKGYATNVRVGEQNQTQLLKFLSPITATLIQRFINQDTTHPQIAIYSDKLLGNILHDVYYPFKTARQQTQLNAALYVMEHHNGFDVSEMTLAILQGKPKTYSLPIANWQVLIQNRRHNEVKLGKLDITNPTHSSNHRKKTNKLLSIKVKKLFDSQSHKLSKNELSENLAYLIDELLRNHAPTNEIAIIRWLAYKLTTCKPSSVQTYSNRLTNRWLALSYELDIDIFDEEDYEALYEEMLIQTKNDSAKEDLAVLLDDFHRFLVKQFRAVSITPLASGTIPHHKTAYLSETMFQAILTACDDQPIGQHDKNNLKTALILAHRLGMRIGEITKLKLKEISLLLEYCEIRDNQYANNKSSSALRRLPIELMLLPDDFAVIRQVYESRKLNNHTTLIATEGGQALLKSNFSQQITSLIQQVTGLDNLSTHSLRHSCISNLQLMLFLTDDDYQTIMHPALISLYKFLPYSPSTAKAIIKQLFGELAFQSNYVIAGFAGHAHPEVSYQSYIHFIDMLMGIILWQIDYQLSETQAKNLLGLPRRKLDLCQDKMAFNSYLIKKLKCKNLPTLTSKTLVSQQSLRPQKYTFDAVKAVLGSYHKHNFDNQCRYYHVAKEVAVKWLANAKMLRDDERFFTKVGKSRLFEKDDNSIVLTKKLTAFESKINTKLMNNFRQHFVEPTHRADLAFFIHYILTHALSHDATLVFDKVEDLQRFLQAINLLELKTYTFLTVHHLSAQDKISEANWQKTWVNLAKNHIAYHNPVMKRQIKTKVELSIHEKRDSEKRQLLSYFAYYVYVMMGETIEKYV